MPVQQWPAYLRTGPTGSSAYWRPVIKVALILVALFTDIVVLDPTM